MAADIGPKIGIDGEAEYRKQLNNIIQQAKTLDSEMKAVTSAFGKNENSQESLTAQSEVLSKQIQEKRAVGICEKVRRNRHTNLKVEASGKRSQSRAEWHGIQAGRNENKAG